MTHTKMREGDILVATVEAGSFNFCANLTVYCEAESKPEGWDENWCVGAKEIVWGHKEGKREK